MVHVAILPHSNAVATRCCICIWFCWVLLPVVMTISNSFSLGCPKTVAYLCGQPTTKWEFQVLKPAQHENPPKLHLICIHKQLGVARNEYIYFAKIYAEHLLKGTSHKLCSKIISCTLSLLYNPFMLFQSVHAIDYHANFNANDNELLWHSFYLHKLLP